MSEKDFSIGTSGRFRTETSPFSPENQKYGATTKCHWPSMATVGLSCARRRRGQRRHQRERRHGREPRPGPTCARPSSLPPWSSSHLIVSSSAHSTARYRMASRSASTIASGHLVDLQRLSPSEPAEGKPVRQPGEGHDEDAQCDQAGAELNRALMHADGFQRRGSGAQGTEETHHAEAEVAMVRLVRIQARVVRSSARVVRKTAIPVRSRARAARGSPAGSVPALKLPPMGRRVRRRRPVRRGALIGTR